jgi:hypothetical protein
VAKKKILISAGGSGIAAGAPFALHGMLFVAQAAPPVAASGRMQQLADAKQSVTAKGVTAALRTFMLGDSVGEGTGNLRSIFIGDNITGVPGAGVGTASDQIFIGTDITELAAYVSVDGALLIGNTPTFSAATGAFGRSVMIGNNLKMTPLGLSIDTLNSVLVGEGGTLNGGDAIGIGAGVIVWGESVNIGKSAIGAGLQSVGVGKAVNLSGNNAIAIGRRARCGNDSVILGFFADGLVATSSIAIGRDADCGAFVGSCVIGRGTVALETNAVALGARLAGRAGARHGLGPSAGAARGRRGAVIPAAADAGGRLGQRRGRSAGHP